MVSHDLHMVMVSTKVICLSNHICFLVSHNITNDQIYFVWSYLCNMMSLHRHDITINIMKSSDDIYNKCNSRTENNNSWTSLVWKNGLLR